MMEFNRRLNRVNIGSTFGREAWQKAEHGVKSTSYTCSKYPVAACRQEFTASRSSFILLSLPMEDGNTHHSGSSDSSQAAEQRATPTVTAVQLDQRTLDAIIAGVTAQLRLATGSLAQEQIRGKLSQPEVSDRPTRT